MKQASASWAATCSVILPLDVIDQLHRRDFRQTTTCSCHAVREESDAGIDFANLRSMLIRGSRRSTRARDSVQAYAPSRRTTDRDLETIARSGSTDDRIALGLLFDTLIVRSFMTPSIAALLGRWFWWPVLVRQRPIPQKFGDENTRQLSFF